MSSRRLVWNLLAASQVNRYFGFLRGWLDLLRRGAEGLAASHGIEFAVTDDACSEDFLLRRWRDLDDIVELKKGIIYG